MIAFSSPWLQRHSSSAVPLFAMLLQRGHPPSLQFRAPRGVPLYPVEMTRLSFTMMAATFLLIQLLREATTFAMLMKYSSHSGRWKFRISRGIRTSSSALQVFKRAVVRDRYIGHALRCHEQLAQRIAAVQFAFFFPGKLLQGWSRRFPSPGFTSFKPAPQVGLHGQEDEVFPAPQSLDFRRIANRVDHMIGFRAQPLQHPDSQNRRPELRAQFIPYFDQKLACYRLSPRPNLVSYLVGQGMRFEPAALKIA